MKRLNLERLIIVSMAIIMVVGFYLQQTQINQMSKLLNKVDIPIEKKDGYYVEVSEIPEELLEKEIIR